ncbi:hypothetical protein JQ597_08495 [Bradyrhizobium sp. AUGA SZCCT0177]|uniref:hypothetical protein n=1 Tax=unclassified Bradyrhizobium TaxID=2631580 RepID=UPI001BA46670|nr:MULTISPECIES: hypothetical protein [unclassified Bradyrhizobium]MBR1234037.1 hypothetical protein [Bradyrhizobium sp. AUGA SZCCT0182]MBR1282070.1 hypothetical protein [Bradyrhizobium sp. AUGA SZCCT0177]
MALLAVQAGPFYAIFVLGWENKESWAGADKERGVLTTGAERRVLFSKDSRASDHGLSSKPKKIAVSAI